MDKQKRLLEESDPGHFSMIRAMHLADLITLLNGMLHIVLLTPFLVLTPISGFCGINSVLSSLRYCMGNPNDLGNLWAALAFMPFGLFFDFMDGKVARWRKKSSLMGQELDSLADLVCYYPWKELDTFADHNNDTDLLLRFSCCRICRNWHANPSRPLPPHLLCPLRSPASCSFQHHHRQCTQGRQRQGQVL